MEIAARALRNETRAVLNRVQHGEPVTITIDGIPVATLQPLPARGSWMPRGRFASEIMSRAADAALSTELRTLVPETTDDLPL